LNLALAFFFPVLAPVRFEKPEPMGMRDPSYAIYQKYRYTYETYVYLFLSEETGQKEPEPDFVPGPSGQVGEQAGAGSGAGAETGAGDGSGAGTEPGSGGGGNGAVSEELYARLSDYDYLMKEFYNVHASTTAPRDLMRAQDFLGTDLSLEKDGTVPQILIYHTHSQETYADFGPGNPGANIVEVGNVLTRHLQALGWNVIHDTSTYDIQGGKLDRNQAYSYALDGITKILKEHPTIQVVLDLHRDGVGENVRLVTEVDGESAAKIMFFQGMSRTPKEEISYLPNPFLKENLAFSFQMQMDAAGRFPGLTRKIYLKGLRYNLHLRGRSALVEVGAQTNTLAEACRSMEPLSKLLDRVLQGK